MPPTRPDQEFTRVAAYGLITDGDRILLCRLSPKSIDGRGLWTLPGGGLDFGEEPVEAMIREVHEETGLDVKAGDIEGVLSSVRASHRGQTHHIRLVYRALVVGGRLRNEVDGSTDLCQWWPQPEVGGLPLTDLVRTFTPRAFAGE